MNLDNIFNAFENSTPLQEKAALISLQETQAFKLGMFKKIIINCLLILLMSGKNCRF